MRELPRRQAPDPGLRTGDQGEPCLQHAAGARRDLGRRAAGLHRPRPRPRQSRLRGVARAQGAGGVSDFLLELLSEEIPARMQAGARASLARMFAEGAAAAGLEAGAIETYSTPRRLVLIAREVGEATAAAREEMKGPRSSAPPQALEGFLRKTGLAARATRGARRRAVRGDRAARPRRDRSRRRHRPPDHRRFPWPKSMRWGDGDLRWVRPLHGIVAMLGEEIVPVIATA